MSDASGRQSSFSISGGSVSIGGDAVAGDKIGVTVSGVAVFSPLDDIIDGQAPNVREAAKESCRALKAEAAKGHLADDSYMAKLIEGMVALVPAAVGAVVSAFASPVLAGVAGPMTRLVLDRLQTK